MIVKKSGGRIIGAQLPAAEKKALDSELDRQLGEFDRKNQVNVEACILWAMHELLGFGPKRLGRFYFGFVKYYSALLEHYEMEDDNAYKAQRDEQERNLVGQMNLFEEGNANERKGRYRAPRRE